MNLPEFKAWFEGYTEDLKDAPTAKQWKRVKEQVAKIDGTPITQTIYRDHYWPRVWPYWSASVGLMASGVSGEALQMWNASSNAFRSTLDASPRNDGIGKVSFSVAGEPEQFNSIPHMFAAGKAEALSDAA